MTTNVNKCEISLLIQTKGKLYLILEYLSGGELFMHLEREGIFLGKKPSLVSLEFFISIF